MSSGDDQSGSHAELGSIAKESDNGLNVSQPTQQNINSFTYSDPLNDKQKSGSENAAGDEPEQDSESESAESSSEDQHWKLRGRPNVHMSGPSPRKKGEKEKRGDK